MEWLSRVSKFIPPIAIGMGGWGIRMIWTANTSQEVYAGTSLTVSGVAILLLGLIDRFYDPIAKAVSLCMKPPIAFDQYQGDEFKHPHTFIPVEQHSPTNPLLKNLKAQVPTFFLPAIVNRFKGGPPLQQLALWIESLDDAVIIQAGDGWEPVVANKHYSFKFKDALNNEAALNTSSHLQFIFTHAGLFTVRYRINCNEFRKPIRKTFSLLVYDEENAPIYRGGLLSYIYSGATVTVATGNSNGPRPSSLPSGVSSSPSAS